MENRKSVASNQKLNTVGEFIQYATFLFKKKQIFFGHGTDNAWDEAVYLTLFSLGLEQQLSATILQRTINTVERDRLLTTLDKRISQRVPCAYITKEAYFAGFKFYVDNRVLIPRSPLAELIINKFTPWIKPEKVKNILEIGTGSGCIAISCAHIFAKAKIDATDIDQKALDVAALNCAKHQVKSRVKLRYSDLFSNIPLKNRYDVIISNPPYVGQAEFQKLPKEYSHEPSGALLAGKSGDEIINRILKSASTYLKPKGILVMEVGNSISLITKAYKNLPLTWLEFENGEGEVLLITKEELLIIENNN